jgi:predicted ATP-dependent serine protease
MESVKSRTAEQTDWVRISVIFAVSEGKGAFSVCEHEVYVPLSLGLGGVGETHN